MVAAERPDICIERAVGTRRSGTSRMMTAADRVQKPPNAIPSSIRPANSVGRFGATATRRLEKTRRSEKPSSTRRRSMRRVMAVTVRLVAKPITAVAVTACPARPSVIPSSQAIGVSRLAGSSSAPTSPKTPSPMETTAPQAGKISLAPLGAAFSTFCTHRISSRRKECLQMGGFSG